mgnify:CR=1 FL=1
MKKFVVPALSLALCLGLVTGHPLLKLLPQRQLPQTALRAQLLNLQNPPSRKPWIP